MTTATRALALISLAILTAGCSSDRRADDEAVQQGTPAPSTPQPTEESTRSPRLALSYDGGVLVLDAATLRQVADIPVDGFVRLNSADNGRHLLVSQADGFTVLDMGTWTDAHGDHGHHYTATPALTDIRFGGAKPGHVVPHDDKLTLFSDGTGAVEVVDPAALLRGRPEAVPVTTVEPHHGVAVARADGSLIVSVGNAESRSGIEILDKSGARIAANNDCPGVHGEANAADGAFTFGCEDGILVVTGNNIRKVASPDAYGRIGNQAGSAQSPVVLGDYKTDADADLERPQRFTLTNTATGALTVVPINASYSFRSLDRGPRGEAIILGTDGALHIFDPATAKQISRLPVIQPWSEPDEWQSPMPNLHVQNGIAYVSEPAARRVVAVDLADGSVVAETTLGKPTIELAGVLG